MPPFVILMLFLRSTYWLQLDQKGFTAEPHLCTQLNAASSLPLHKDKKQLLQVMAAGPWQL